MLNAEPRRTQRNTENHVTYTSRLLQALIKIYSLVDCPIYSVVKYRPREFAISGWPLASGQNQLQQRSHYPPKRAWIVSNPMFGTKNHLPSWRPTLNW